MVCYMYIFFFYDDVCPQCLNDLSHTFPTRRSADRPVPLLALANAVALWRTAMDEGRDARPFILALSFFVLGFIGLVLGIWPNIVPPDLGIHEAASSMSSQLFPGVGLLFLLPAILGYTICSYRVFRGKVEAGDRAE